MLLAPRWFNRLALSLTVLALVLAPARPSGADEGRLVVLVVVDGLGAGTLERNIDVLQAGGFRRLIEEGAWYTQAAYSYAVSSTAPGHATLLTGVAPFRHGIVGNRWLDRAEQKMVAAVSDPRYRILGDGNILVRTGRAPTRLLMPTVGDRLVEATGWRSKVVTVAWKDRSAILSAGRLGEAWWFSRSASRFTTSSFYRWSLPVWMVPLAQADAAKAFRGRKWTLLASPRVYQRVQADDRPWEADFHGLGRTFPHALGEGTKYPRALGATPFANELTLAVARAAVEGEALGRRGVADLLLIGLSATDIAQHVFGPLSVEVLDMLLRLDEQLAAFFRFLDERVGSGRYTVVLTADHGFTASPEARRAAGQDGGRIGVAEAMERVEAALDSRFGPAAWVAGWAFPFLYLDESVIAERGVEAAEVRRGAAQALEGLFGIHRVFTREELEQPAVPGEELAVLAQRSYHPERAGDLLVIARPGWLIEHRQWRGAANHGSPWLEDRHVPLLLAGWGVRQGRFDRPVRMIEVAPTLARLVGLASLPGGEGRPLVEALRENLSSVGR